MRQIGIPEIEDIALGAALLGAGGGGDPYVGKLVAIGAVKEHGPVTLLEPEEVPDDALIVPIAMMGAPTVLCEKAVGGSEYKTLYDTVSGFFGKPIYAFMPMEAGGVNSMLPIAAAARLIEGNEFQGIHITHQGGFIPFIIKNEIAYPHLAQNSLPGYDHLGADEEFTGNEASHTFGQNFLEGTCGNLTVIS